MTIPIKYGYLYKLLEGGCLAVPTAISATFHSTSRTFAASRTLFQSFAGAKIRIAAVSMGERLEMLEEFTN